MVFSESDRNNLKNEPEFNIFLDEYPEAYIEIHDKNDLPIEIAEWYCRWIHAKRVHQILVKVGDFNLKWNGVSLRKVIGNVCESHNLDIDVLKDDDKFSSNFLGIADLKFCSILLRLADILDFDRSRSPLSVYKYLNLDKKNSKRISESDIEWRKHLCSSGFQFPIVENELKFIAAPDNPAVENDVREFLDVIDAEFNKCRSILKFCNNRWQDFVLPEKIDRKNIIAQGYKFGNFKFTLDQEKILELLMGENLYDNRYVFVREVLQNAIDTSRYRVFHEHSKRNFDFAIKPVRITDWIDKDGYKWIRVDDFGMGMDESKIKNYLLKVGNSYYNSSEFKVDKLLYKNKLNEDFTPISRFGIGLLSCFIAGDKVEISTKPVIRRVGENNIRISIEGLHNYYVLQTGNDIPLQMPNEENKEEGYRDEYGTSISIRINPAKEFDRINLEEILRKLVYASEIGVCYEQSDINKSTNDVVLKPFVGYSCIKIEENDIKKLNDFLQEDVGGMISAEIIPLDLTKFSPSKYLLGQFVLVHLNVPDRYKKYTGIKEIGLSDKLMFIASKEISEDINRRREYLNLDLKLWEKVCDFVEHKQYDKDYFFVYPLRISHNGIVVPKEKIDRNGNDNETNLTFNDNVFENNFARIHHNSHNILFGTIALKDRLRPEVSTSRDQIKPLSWDIYSNISLSFLRAFNNSEYCKEIKLNSVGILGDYFDYQSISLGELLNEDLIQAERAWQLEKINNVDSKYYNIPQILELMKAGKKNLPIYFPLNDSFHRLLSETLLQKNFNISYSKNENYNSLNLKSIRSEPLSENIKLFFPLEFVPFENLEYFLFNDSPFNLNHKFSEWFIGNSIDLKEKYPGIFKLILNLIRNLNGYFWVENRNIEIITSINSALKRLRELNDDNLKPPLDIDLKETDIFRTKRGS
jgi:hypothetical protein